MHKISPFSFKLKVFFSFKLKVKVQSSVLAFHRLRMVSVAMDDNSFVLKCSRIQFSAFVFECYSALLHTNKNAACRI